MQGLERRKGAKRVDFSKLKSYNADEVELFNDFIGFLKQRNEFDQFLKEKKQLRKNTFPLSIFRNNSLAPLETLVKYLRENLDYSYVEIGNILHRNAGPVGVSYRKAKLKFSGKLDVSSKETIPLLIFKTKNSVFETIVVYLKDKEGLKFKKIAELLDRNYRTIWTVYNRAKK